MRRKRVDEEDQHVDPALGDQGPDLLVAAERAALQARDRERRAAFHHALAGGAGGVERETRKRRLMRRGEIRHLGLLVVMRDERQGPAALARAKLPIRLRHCCSPIMQSVGAAPCTRCTSGTGGASPAISRRILVLMAFGNCSRSRTGTTKAP